MGRLEGKIALITGAARSIGRGFAERYVAEGARVAIVDIDFDEAKKTAVEIGESAAFAIRLDVADQHSIDACVRQVVQHFGAIHILVNNAGTYEITPVVDVSRDTYERLFSVNVAGTLFMMQAVAKHMIAGAKGGRIINIASMSGRRGEPLVSVYCATKAAVISLTQSAGLELAKHGILVNAIAPGAIDTRLMDIADAMFAKLEGGPIGQRKKALDQAVPLGRIGQPRDLASMAVFLASEDADYVVGQTYNVDGGVCLN